MTVGFK